MLSDSVVKVFFFGDSICSGQGISIHDGWVTRTSAKLFEFGLQLGCDILVNNASINGNTTRQALERMPYDIQSHRADILIVQFGLNDCNYWESDQGVARVSPAAFKANLHEIVARAVKFGAYKILLVTNHVTGRNQNIMPHTDITYDQSSARYNEIIRCVANELKPNVILVDIEKVCQDYILNHQDRLLQLLQPDLLHLSLAGHDLYFNTFYPVIVKVIEDFLATKRLSIEIR